MLVHSALTVAGIALGVFGFLGAVFSARVFVNLMKSGPSAAEEAYARGDSVKSWLAAEQVPVDEHPRHTERYRFAGRRGSALGDTMVEERASFPRYAR